MLIYILHGDRQTLKVHAVSCISRMLTKYVALQHHIELLLRT
nr:MAG TPA: hypothetical protein [Caudoviricetes sp.]